MTWEEYENSDWYRESHPNEDYRSPEEKLRDKKAELMRECVYDIDNYRKQTNGYIEHNGELYEKTSHRLVEDTVLNTTFVCAKTWNGRVRGIICSGSYEQCRMAAYEYDVANINNEWEWACVEEITYSNEDELDDILNEYRELSCEPYYDYDDYDY